MIEIRQFAPGVLSLLLTLIASSVACSEEPGDWHLVIHTRSWHASHPVDVRWNESNWRLGLRRKLSEDWSAQAGAFRNSLKKTSAYGLVVWALWHYGRGRWECLRA